MTDTRPENSDSEDTSNYEDLISRFSQAMSDDGLELDDEVIPDGTLHRAHAADDKPGTKDAWYVLFIDEGIATGIYGHWAYLNKKVWHSHSEDQLSAPQRARVSDRQLIAKELRSKEVEAIRKECLTKASTYWVAAHEASQRTSLYLKHKGIQAHGTKMYKGALLVPIRSQADELVGLQFIQPDGAKKFLRGTQKSCSRFIISGNSDRTLLCEGFATGASLHEATGDTVVVAFDAGNLLLVAQSVRSELGEGARLIVCADNDASSQENVGVKKAREAAIQTGALLAIPPHTGQGKGTDFNDLHSQKGLQAVRDAVDSAGPATLESPAETKDSPRDIVLNLAKLDELEYFRSRKEAAKQLGITQSALDKVVNKARALLKQETDDASGSSEPDGSMFEPVDPWPRPVNAALLLDELVRLIQRFIVLPVATARAAALWIAFTWMIDHMKVAPIAMITAPEKRCGKTQLLALFIRLCRRPLSAANISASAIFRCIEAWGPTLLIDEADAFLRDNEDARGILNSGHTRDTAYVIRVVELKGELVPKAFSTWGAKAIAGIGRLADTLADRSISLELRRKLPGEQADKLRHADDATFIRLRQQLCRLSLDAGEAIRSARPESVEALNDRAQDNWEPLFAIADLAGGHWPHMARSAALSLSGEAKEAPSLNAELLSDIKAVFEKSKETRLGTSDLINSLCGDEEAPWATFNRGQPMRPRQLAQRLREFGISSGTVRTRFGAVKGYKLEQFDEAFKRYLQDQPEERSQRHNPDTTRLSAAGGTVTPEPMCHIAACDNSSNDASCDDVTDIGEQDPLGSKFIL